ncbi:MAG: hypothetical protein KAY59_08560, partial [Acidobacteria bacterium]|nr:hypothetical protein [Acidobacteriota bacterium]
MLRSGYAQLSKLLNAIASWRWFWWATFVGCAVPAGILGWEIYTNDLGVDPLKQLLHETGEDSLGVLLACLAITPIRRVFKVNPIQKVRKMVGLWAFFYAFVHVCLYLGLDQLCYS